MVIKGTSRTNLNTASISAVHTGASGKEPGQHPLSLYFPEKTFGPIKGIVRNHLGEPEFPREFGVGQVIGFIGPEGTAVQAAPAAQTTLTAAPVAQAAPAALP